jgi:hypothetical protein
MLDSLSGFLVELLVSDGEIMVVKGVYGKSQLKEEKDRRAHKQDEEALTSPPPFELITGE